MAVNWYWNHKKGELTCKGRKNKNYKVNIYQANCLGALIYEYKDQETKEDMYSFWGFWNDIHHLKKNLGLEGKDTFNIYEEVKKIKLNTYYKDSIKIAELFARVKNIKVELYYKEPKIKPQNANIK